MEAVTLVMPRQQARKAYLEYRRTVTLNRTEEDARRRAEDAALMRAYREIARGNPVIDLPATMKAAGLRAGLLPEAGNYAGGPGAQLRRGVCKWPRRIPQSPRLPCRSPCADDTIRAASRHVQRVERSLGEQ